MNLTFMIYKPVRTQLSDEEILEMIAEDEKANLEIKKQEQMLASYGFPDLKLREYVEEFQIPFETEKYLKNFNQGRN
jgi:hypothetical protein